MLVGTIGRIAELKDNLRGDHRCYLPMAWKAAKAACQVNTAKAFAAIQS
jgi:hypothetical protein